MSLAPQVAEVLFSSLFILVSLDTRSLCVVVCHLVHVAAKLGVARLEPSAVETVALLDGFLYLLVVAEPLVATACGGEMCV